MKKFIEYIILAILILFIIICFNNKTIEGFTIGYNFASDLCTGANQNGCVTNWQTRNYFKDNYVDGSKLLGNPCVWNVTTKHPDGICQNSPSAAGWGYTFTAPAMNS
jgi:hypothetical protein